MSPDEKRRARNCFCALIVIMIINGMIANF